MDSYSRPKRDLRPEPVAAERPAHDFRYTMRKLAKCQHLYLAETRHCGFGVFAARRFRSGDVIMMDLDGDYYAQVMTYQQLTRLGITMDYTLQVGLDAFKLPSGNIDDFTNHSCAPNSGIRLYVDGPVVLAIGDIAVHEQITYDYSTYLNNRYERMPCHCGAQSCRGIIGNFSELPEDLRRRYLELDIVGRFALEPRYEEEPSL